MYKDIRLAHVGFSDPIYAEAYVKMHGFDILLGTISLFAYNARAPGRHM